VASTVRAPNSGVDPERFTSVLSWRVLDRPTQGEWLLGANFSSTELSQTLTKPESRVTEPVDAPFLLRIDRDCRFTGLGFSPKWTPAARRLVATVLRTFEVVVSSGAPLPTWETSQTDGTGTYAATYRAERTDDGTLHVHKKKSAYRQAQGQGLGILADVSHADSDATFDGQGHWFTTIQGHERMLLRAQGQVLADLEQEFSLSRDDAKFSQALPTSLDPADFRWDDPFTPEPEAEHPVDRGLLTLSFADAMARFDAIYRKAKTGDAYAAALFLADWLRARPERALELMAAIRAAKVPEELRPAAFLALERCGTREASTVLREALGDRRMTSMDRARAATALSDVPNPTMEAMNALATNARSAPAAGDQDAQVVAGTSLRALGHLAERTEKLDPALHTEALAELRRDLASAQGSSRVVDVVDALGNSGDESLVPALKDRLADSSPQVREHVVRAFRRMDPSEATGPLLAQLAVETDPEVKAAILDTLVSLGSPDARTVEPVAQALPAETSPVVRAAMIRLLGAAVASVPAAKVALVRQFQRETVPQLLQLIGRYVAPGELR
jgi:hypothetical protein